MRLPLTFVVVLLCLQVEGWIALIESDENHTSHCFTNSFHLGAMKKNETVRVKDECAQAVCQEDRNIKVTGCAPMAARPPCYVVKGDINNPFPQCCWEIRCDNNEVSPTKNDD